MVIYARSEEMPFSHVSIVTAVDQSGVYTGEQTMRNVPVWKDNYTKKLELINSGTCTLVDGDLPIIGWMRATTETA